MKEEVSKILKMVEEGKITSDKAGELISALDAKNEIAEVKSVTSTNYLDKMFKINVNTKDGDNVHVKLPVKVIKALGGAAIKIPGVNEKVSGGLDMDMILKALDSEAIGKILDVETSDGDFVEIVIE